MIFSLVFVTIEVIDPEPAAASGEFSCIDADGRTYLFQSTWSGSTLTINRGINDDSGTFSTSVIESFSSWHSSHEAEGIEEVNSLSIQTDGSMYAILKIDSSANDLYLYKLNYNSSGAGSTEFISTVDLGTGENNAASNYETTDNGTTYKYIFTSKGFFNGNQKVIRINSNGCLLYTSPSPRDS